MQKVILQVELIDPSQAESQTNRNYIKGQTIMMFNRGVSESVEKDSKRELRLDIHCKNITVLGISLAQRYKRVDEVKKTSETFHERKESINFQINDKELEEYQDRCTFNGTYEKKGDDESIELHDTFKFRPSIQNFDLYQSLRFKQEKKKGLLTIDKILCLEPDDLFPPNLDIIIDYEITNICDYNLSFRTTNEPSGKGCYLATTHRYFETHYWIPCIDSLKQKNKWKMTIITDKNNQVACSGNLEKIIEIENNQDKFAYSYRLDHSTPACKIGFFVGRKFLENDNRFFSNNRRMEDFNKYFVLDQKIVYDITETYEQVLGRDFPYQSIDLIFVPNLFNGSKKHKRRALCYTGVCFIDEEIIFNDSIIENRYSSYFHIAYAIATNYFGCYIHEEKFNDFWLMEGISQSLATLYTVLRCGFLINKFKMLKKIEYVRDEMEKGNEIYPLYSEYVPYPSYLQHNDFYFVKSGIILHIIESKIKKEHFHKLLKVIIKECSSKHSTLSTEDFSKKFKKLCGLSTKKLLYNWVYSTGALDITFKYEFSKKNNTVSIVIDQRNILSYYLARSKFLKNKKEEHNLSVHNLYSKEYKDQFSDDQTIESYEVEKIRDATRWFIGSCFLYIYETDGSTIRPEQHKLEFNRQKPQIKLTIPLKNKVRKTNQNKKKDYPCGPAIASDQWRFQPSDSVKGADGTFYKSEIFNLKNLECSLLWVRIDPELEFIRRVNICQSEDNWHYQLLKEKDIIGQYEAIHALKNFKTEQAYDALKHVIQNKEYFYKIRQEAVKAITEMKTKDFQKYLSTEKLLIKIFNEYDEKGYPKYRDNQIRYFIDKTIIKYTSFLRESTSIYKLCDIGDFDLRYIRNFSTKDLQKFLLDLLKKHFSSKMLFDDSYYIANVIVALGNVINMKGLSEAVSEIIRQAKVDLARSTNLMENVMGSYNNSILKSCIASLTNLYDNLKILQTQLFKKHEQRNKTESKDNDQKKVNNNQKQMNKVQIEMDARKRIQKQCPIIERFLESIPSFSIYNNLVDLQILYFRYQIIKIFSEHKFMKSVYMCLSLINEQVEFNRVEIASEYFRNLREYLDERMNKKEDIDYIKIYDPEFQKTQAIHEILWNFQALDTTFNHSQFRNEVSSFMWMLFREIGMRDCQIDEDWKDYTKRKGAQSLMYDERSQKDIVSMSGMKRPNDFESDAMSDQYSLYRNQAGKKKSDGKNIIKLNTLMAFGQTEQSFSKMNESVYRSEMSYGSEYQDKGRKKRKTGEGDESYADNESQFAMNEDINLGNMDWKDCCLNIIDKIEEYEESDDFKLPVTKEDYGDYWEDYKKIITYPIDLSTVRAKIYEGDYVGVGNFEFDMRKIFDNCKKFNEPGSQIYENATMLDQVFSRLFKPVKKKFGEKKNLKEAGIRITMGGIDI